MGNKGSIPFHSTKINKINITKKMIECNYCNSTEITYNQLVMDSYCSECGEWQNN